MNSTVISTQKFIFVFFFTFVLHLTNSYAQGTLLSFADIDIASLKEDAINRFELASKSPYNDGSPVIVEVGDLPSLQKEGNLYITLPGFDETTYLFNAERVEFKENGDYDWIGVLKADTTFCDGYGRVYISRKEGRTFGHLQIEGNTYELEYLGQNLSTLIKINKEALNAKAEHPEIEPEKRGKPPVFKQGTFRGASCDVRILVLYNTEAETLLPNVGDEIHTAFVQFKDILLNSNVQNTDLKPVLAGVEKVNFITTNNPGIDITVLAGDATVLGLRTKFDADLVVLITNNTYTGAFGVASLMAPSPTAAFAIVEGGASALVGRYTFTHELGHLFGCDHNVFVPTPGINHGWGFSTGRRICFNKRDRYTVMAVPIKLLPQRVPHFSNPKVLFQGECTGKVDVADNAQVLRDNGCKVATHFNSTFEPFIGYITGPTQVVVDKPFFLETTLTGGDPTITPSITYSWAHSTDGFNYTSLPNTTQSIGFLAPNIAYKNLYFRVIITITTLVGTETLMAFHTVQTIPAPSNTDFIKANPSTSVVNEDNTLSISPIPANDDLAVHFYNTDIEMINMVVTDITGKVMSYQNNIPSFVGKNQRTISVASLPDGIYFIQLLGTNNFKASKSFVVHH